MKFMLTWKVRPGKLQEAIDRFLGTGDPMTPGVTSIARYHRTDLQGGVHIVEASSAAALAQYAANWADLLDVENAAVVEDAEAIHAYSRVSGVKAQAQGVSG
jgi:hypothetical protein